MNMLKFLFNNEINRVNLITEQPYYRRFICHCVRVVGPIVNV